MRSNQAMIPGAGFVPPTSVTSNKVRATGQMSELISLDTIAYEAERPIPLTIGREANAGCGSGQCGCGH
jgi:hypothetical protein